MNEPIIRLKELSKKYGMQTAVNRLTLDIYKGEIFGLLGPNGAGKSTTILMMLGLSEPSFGSVEVCGIDSTRDPIEVKKKVGYLPDEVGFYEDRSGLENLVYTGRLNGMSYKEAANKASELLDRVGLNEAADKKVGAYSRGMRQRLGLADVLIKEPEVIILDEPTLGIDPKGVNELLALIRKLSRDMGITVLLSSHHLHQVQQICDRVGLFVGGELIAEGDVPSLSQKLFGNEGIVVHVKIDHLLNELVERLKCVEGVENIKVNENAMHISCMYDVTAAIAKTVFEYGANLLHLNKQEFGLDEIYQRYFEGDEHDAEAVV